MSLPLAKYIKGAGELSRKFTKFQWLTLVDEYFSQDFSLIPWPFKMTYTSDSIVKVYVSKDSTAIHLTGSLPWKKQIKESRTWVWNSSSEWLRLAWPWVTRWFHPIVRYKKFLGRGDIAIIRVLLDLASYNGWVLC